MIRRYVGAALLAACLVFQTAQGALEPGDVVAISFGTEDPVDTPVLKGELWGQRDASVNFQSAGHSDGQQNKLINTRGGVSGLRLSWKGKSVGKGGPVNRRKPLAVGNLQPQDVFGSELVTGFPRGGAINPVNTQSRMELVLQGLQAGESYRLCLLTGRGNHYGTYRNGTVEYTLTGVEQLEVSGFGASHKSSHATKQGVLTSYEQNAYGVSDAHWAMVEWSFVASGDKIVIRSSGFGDINALAIKAKPSCLPTILLLLGAVVLVAAGGGIWMLRRRKSRQSRANTAQS